MRNDTNARAARHAQRGISLIMVAVGMFVLLGVSALAIDLAMLYVTRNEAQRAADAAALAGAQGFVASGYTSGFATQAAAQALATQRAQSIGAQNTVGGLPANIQGSDLTFDFSVPENPRITVVVQRSAARLNAMPTFFARAFGVLSADIAAKATAEAFNPSGSLTGPTFCASCLKPVVLPNCDPNPLHTFLPNPFCPGFAKYVDPACLANSSYPGICNPSAAPAGVIGQSLLLRPGQPSQAPVPSQYYSLAIGGSGASTYRQNIETCSPLPFACGDTLNLETGNMVGPTQQGFHTLINQPGQDTIDPTTLQMFAGASNPLVTAGLITQGSPISTSSSLVTVPLYQGQNLCPGGSCGSSVTIVGYLTLFVTDVSGGANVNAVIVNVANCGGGSSGTCGSSGGAGGPGGSVSGGSSLIPIRLIRNP